ncbi:uncharacterized protein DUF4154 [Sulfuritortus calidifontis]|uniref:Uncharacterized protein DUF4154 n=1 Tax=Sulfuritortus calidifontis TaxID=1914471 RepID=A0A4V2UR57_9PROT|nr:YfiR family protein [Sulfuritortus calidifontis]TCS74097.1 uncharacterized protein DUF4154 [Sulfuritortus calidifontis]
MPLGLRPTWSNRPLLALLALLAALGSVARAEGLTEYQAKAAMLYNFPKFIDWPAGTRPGAMLCVLGPDPFGPALDSLQGKPLRNGAVSIARPASVQAALTCQVLFIAGADNLNRVLAGLGTAPVLTIGEEEGMAARGVMIELIREGPRIAFKINLSAARRAGLSISSQLLKLAREVY